MADELKWDNVAPTESTDEFIRSVAEIAFQPGLVLWRKEMLVSELGTTIIEKLEAKINGEVHAVVIRPFIRTAENQEED